MRTVIRSCRSHERSRRTLLRLAEPVACSATIGPTAKVCELRKHKKQVTPRALTVVVVVVVVVVVKRDESCRCQHNRTSSLAREPSTTNNCWPSRAPKNPLRAGHSTSKWRECENCNNFRRQSLLRIVMNLSMNSSEDLRDIAA